MLSNVPTMFDGGLSELFAVVFIVFLFLSFHGANNFYDKVFGKRDVWKAYLRSSEHDRVNFVITAGFATF